MKKKNMETVKDQKQLERYMEQYRIREMFDTDSLDFQLVHYRKGERMASADVMINDLLFLAEGTVKVYGIREDAGIIPVNEEEPLQIYGDMEFATGHPGMFFVEAVNDVYCIALPFRENEEVLRKDARFLNTLLSHLGEKVENISILETCSTTLEERVLYYLKETAQDHMIHSVSSAMSSLRCSRRQLQRVLHDLCASGTIVKVKKGCYLLKQ